LPPSRFRDPDLPVRPPRSLPRLRVLTRGQSSALDAVAAAWKANSGKTASIVYASSAVQSKLSKARRPIYLFPLISNGWIISKKPSSSVQERGAIS
jgi:hypothetical protein